VEIKVVNESYNPVMKRKEIRVELYHASAGTPERFSTRKTLAERFNAKLDNVYVTDMITGTGTQMTVCNVELYDDQVAAQVVPTYIKTRNLPSDERKKVEKKAEKKEVKPPVEKKPEKKEEKLLEKPQKPAEKKVEKPPEKVEKKPEKPERKEEKPAEKRAEKKEAKKEESKSVKK
jgi:ribosomal protein S24E